MDRLFRIDFYPQDWLLKTARLTPEQRGIYIQIVALIYSQRGAIDDDAAWIAGTCKCSARLVRSVVAQLQAMDFIQISEGKIGQRRSERELDKKRAHLQRSSNGGRASSESKPEPNNDNGLGSSVPEPAVPTPSPSPTPSAIKERKGEDSLPLEKPELAMAKVWNAVLGGAVPTIAKVSDGRALKLRKRLAEDFDDDIEQWRQFCVRISNSPNLVGTNHSGWTATIDWVLEPANLIKVLEGNYDRKPTDGNRKPANNAKPSPHANLFAGFGLTDLE